MTWRTLGASLVQAQPRFRWGPEALTVRFALFLRAVSVAAKGRQDTLQVHTHMLATGIPPAHQLCSAYCLPIRGTVDQRLPPLQCDSILDGNTRITLCCNALHLDESMLMPLGVIIKTSPRHQRRRITWKRNCGSAKTLAQFRSCFVRHTRSPSIEKKRSQCRILQKIPPLFIPLPLWEAVVRCDRSRSSSVLQPFRVR